MLPHNAFNQVQIDWLTDLKVQRKVRYFDGVGGKQDNHFLAEARSAIQIGEVINNGGR